MYVSPKKLRNNRIKFSLSQFRITLNEPKIYCCLNEYKIIRGRHDRKNIYICMEICSAVARSNNNATQMVYCENLWFSGIIPKQYLLSRHLQNEHNTK